MNDKPELFFKIQIQTVMLLEDLQSDDCRLHKKLISQFGGMEPSELVGRALVENGDVSPERYQTIVNFINNSGQKLIEDYANHSYTDTGLTKLNRIYDIILESKQMAEVMKLELIRKQVKLLLEGRNFSKSVLDIYNKAKYVDNWNWIDELVNEMHPVPISVLLGDRDPFIKPLNEAELLKAKSLLSTMGMRTSSIDAVEKWLKGEINLKEEPEQLEYTLSDLIPVLENKNEIEIEYPPEFREW